MMSYSKADEDAKDIISKYHQYTLQLNCRALEKTFDEFIPNISGMMILSKGFIEAWEMFEDSVKRLVFSRINSRSLRYAALTVEEMYGLATHSMVEIDRNENHIRYNLFGLGVESNARQFAKDNFKYYRLKKSGQLGMSQMPSWILTIEAQELTVLAMLGKVEYA